MSPSSSSRRRWLASSAATAAAVPLSVALAYPTLAHAGSGGSATRRVFISSNATAGNELLVFDDDDGALALRARIVTGGLGTGGGLGSQGAVTVTRDGRHLLVVNALSNSVSLFRLTRFGPVLADVAASGGTTPTSVAEHRGLVYVLNAGGDGNVSGLRIRHGRLQPLADGLRTLSAAGGTAPAQVGFSDDGEALVVSERATQRLTSWPVRHDGTLGRRIVTASPGVTPFGFAFTRRNRLIVSEAAGGAPGASSVSSYRFSEDDDARPRVVTAVLPTTQTAACWIAVTPDGRFAYSANAGSSSVSAIAIGRRGELTLRQAVAASTGTNAGALDMAVTPCGTRLHVFASRALMIVSYGIDDDGSLSEIGRVGGLMAGAVGLASA